MCRVGEMETTADWVMEEHLTKPLPRSPAALVQDRTAVAISSGDTTPAPSLTTVLYRAGERGNDGRLGNGGSNAPDKIHPRLRTALVQVAQLWRCLPDINTPAPSSTTVLCRAGD